MRELTAVISQTVEYSLRAAVVLARHDPQPCTVQRIAELTEVPAPYLAKLMQRLVRAGLVHSRRGLHGGFALSRRPHELSIWDIVAAVEPFKRIRVCPLRLGAHANELCPLHRRLDEAMETVESSFRGTALADLLIAAGGAVPLCAKTDTVTLDVIAPPLRD